MDCRIWGTSKCGLFEYVSLTNDKLDEALEVLHEGFFQQEMTSLAVGLHEHPEAVRELDNLVINLAKQGVSLIAVEKSTKKVVGCTINTIVVKGAESILEMCDWKHPVTKYFVDVGLAIGKAFDFFDFLQTDCYAEIAFTGVLDEFKHIGIGGQLQAISCEMGKRLGNGENVKASLEGNSLPLHPVPTAFVGYSTSAVARKIATKIGSVVATEINLQEVLKDSCLPRSVISKLSPISAVYMYVCKNKI